MSVFGCILSSWIRIRGQIVLKKLPCQDSKLDVFACLQPYYYLDAFDKLSSLQVINTTGRYFNIESITTTQVGRDKVNKVTD